MEATEGGRVALFVAECKVDPGCQVAGDGVRLEGFSVPVDEEQWVAERPRGQSDIVDDFARSLLLTKVVVILLVSSCHCR